MFGWGLFFIKKQRRGALKKIASGQGTRPFLSRLPKVPIGQPCFTTINSASYLFNFQPSDQIIFLRHSSRLDHESNQKQTTRSEPRSDYYIRQSSPTRPPNQTIRLSDHHLQSRPPVQLTTPDHSKPALTAQLPISTAYPTSCNGTGQVHSLWVGSRGVYRALDEPCKAYFPHTFGLKFPDFFRLYLTVVRLVSGVPWAGKGLPFPFS